MNDKELEDLVLKTLSFYEAMNLTQIIFDFDAEVLKAYPKFNQEDLQNILKRLEKRKLVKRSLDQNEIRWIRLHPKRSWWQQVFSLFKKY